MRWAPSSAGSFLKVLAYAEAELGLGLGASRPVGIQGGNGQGFIHQTHARHLLWAIAARGAGWTVV